MNRNDRQLALIAPRGASEHDFKAAVERRRTEIAIAIDERRRAAQQQEREEAEVRERAIFRYD